MYYGVGLLIGLLFVIFFFGNRGCSWLPENRIKSSIFSQVLVIDTTAMVEKFTDSMYIVTIVEADINLGLSLRQGEPKAYYFANKKKGNKARFFQVTFETDGVVGIVKTIPEDQKAKIQTGNYWYPIIHVPGDSNFISFHEDVQAKIDFFKLNRQQIHNALKSTGIAETQHFDFDAEQRKIHRMTFQHLGITYKILVRYFQNSLQLMDIDDEN